MSESCEVKNKEEQSSVYVYQDPSGGQRWGVMVVFNLKGLDVSL